jgi:Flp pilus assembly protein TadD
MRLAPRLVALLLCASALSGCSAAGLIAAAVSDDAKPTPPPAAAPKPAAVAGDVEGNVRQAQLLRIAGNYDAAIRILSQLMLVAPDDPRVTAEYGKTLAQKGRASDAAQFLRRAIELAPTDWTLYSALGVSYDQIGDQVNARAAYEHALALKPNDAGVLNNYALSRMLAKDPEGARVLIARAQTAGGGADTDKIARNLAMINDMAPEGAKPEAVAAAPAPAPKVAESKPPPKVASAAPTPVKNDSFKPAEPGKVAAPAENSAPRTAGDVARLLASQPAPVANAAPRALPSPQQSAPPIPVVDTPPANLAHVEAQPIAQAPIIPSGVVMQAVPYDPYAGPVAKLHPPKPKAVAKSEPKPAPEKTADKPAKVPALRMAADKY